MIVRPGTLPIVRRFQFVAEPAPYSLVKEQTGGIGFENFHQCCPGRVIGGETKFLGAIPENWKFGMKLHPQHIGKLSMFQCFYHFAIHGCRYDP